MDSIDYKNMISIDQMKLENELEPSQELFLCSKLIVLVSGVIYCHIISLTTVNLEKKLCSFLHKKIHCSGLFNSIQFNSAMKNSCLTN